MSKTEDFDEETLNTSNHPEVMGVLLMITSLVIFLSLATFNQGAPSLNWLGAVGHGIAIALFYTFGILSYPLNLLLIWFGWKKLSHKPIEQIGSKAIHLSIMTFSICILLSALAESYPQVASYFKYAVYHQKIQLVTPLLYNHTRVYLGGFFSYYLYLDLPKFNFYHLLSNIGVTIVFFTTFLVSFLLLSQFRPSDFISYLQEKFEKEEDYEDEETTKKTFQFSTIYNPILHKIKNFFSRKELSTESYYEEMPVDDLYPSATKYDPSMYTPSTQNTSTTPNIHIPFEKKPNIQAFLEDAPQKRPLKEEVVLSSTGRTLTKRESALEAQRVYNGDFTHYQLPSSKLLTNPKRVHQPTLKKDLRDQAGVLEETLLSFGIEAKVGEIHCGPTIVSFEVHPATGVKVQKIKALENDIALNLQAKSIRIIAPIPGKAVVGIEIPAPEAQEVSFKEILEDYRSSKHKFHIPVLLGQTVSGEHVMTDLARMPHCIIAGATGTGKSVCINAIVMSMLFNCKPDDLKLILIDPKKVELSPYTNLPHMLAPVITEPEGVISALKWLVREMENRYEVLKLLGLRNIASFNTRQIDKTFEDALDLEIPDKMYYIVCIIDELADLMMLSSNEIEVPIARIAQMARAVGIHLILATQRPSREVITGLIKANFPTRVSFKVASRVNSQIILDEIGAESLLGCGDMLFMPPGAASLIRTQGCFIYDQDVHTVVSEICKQAPPNYLIDSFDQIREKSEFDDNFLSKSSPSNPNLDSLYDQAVDLVMKTGSISTTFLQRKLKIGYARAASIMDQLEDQGLISAQDGSKPRKLLLSDKNNDDYSFPEN